MAKYVAGIRERKKQQTRDTLAMSAVTITMTEGLESATIARIAELANVSSRTFHNYFPHRDAAIRHFFEQYIDRLCEEILGMPEGMHPVELIQSMTVRQFQQRRENDQPFMQLDTLFISIRESPHLDVIVQTYMDLQKLAGALSRYTQGQLGSSEAYTLINACIGVARGLELQLLNNEDISEDEELLLLNGAFDALKRGFSTSV